LVMTWKRRFKGFLLLGISLVFFITFISSQSEEIESDLNFLIDLEQVRINFIYDGEVPPLN